MYSFQRVPLSDDPATFVGTDNYAKVLGDESFVESLVVTLQYTAGYVVLATVLGLLFALLLDQPLRGRGHCPGASDHPLGHARSSSRG